MTKYIQQLLIGIFLFAFISCKPKPNYDKVFKENNKEFELKLTELNQLIKDIQLTGLVKLDTTKETSILIDNLNEHVKNRLKKLGVGSIGISKNSIESCDKKVNVVLNIVDSWNIETLKVVQLVYAPCDKNTIKNYHFYDGYHRDFWGQGEGWFIYSDTDFI